MATNSWNFTTRATWLVETPTLCTDWPTAALHILQLVTCSLSAILLSSSRLISSSLRWGPFSCCLTISAAAFLCCWERGVSGNKRNEHRDSACAEELACLWVNSPTKRAGEKGAEEQRRSQSKSVKQKHTFYIVCACVSCKLNPWKILWGGGESVTQ